MMFLQVIILLAGFLFLVKGADWFVEGAASIAKKLGMKSRFFLPLQEPNLCKDKFRYLNSMEENL